MTAAWQALPSVPVRTCMSTDGIVGERAAGDDVGTHGMTAYPLAPRVPPRRRSGGCPCGIKFGDTLASFGANQDELVEVGS
jgi:hypothetical protein